MNMSAWAEKEIELACKKENPDWGGERFDYGCSCYQSALKAYNSLLEDEHSGFSIILTKHILNRLIEHKPLTSITEEDFTVNENTIYESDEYLKERGLKSSIQCPRYSALFRDEHLDGTLTYHDINRYYCFNVNDSQDTFTGDRFSKILDEYFPITLPYFPLTKKYRIAIEELSVDSAIGDFDTTAVWYILTPDDQRIEINRFFKDIEDDEQHLKEVEISLGEFNERKRSIKNERI